MRNRSILDQKGDHTTSGGQHHPNSKAHERFFECGKIASEAFSLVRNGEIAEPVAEITVASNLAEMFASLVPANDLEFRYGSDSPTLLIPEMTVGAA